ncbi:type IV pilus twitching motility protein PilT [Vibrio salinus]|uniref:type IV pilus twitching motility protein PilT n=1 Tax=Vibrio salinus TaxID=2899784 RepID=UPI001E552B04|nr:type IV pilus twitching motility protein PilT [Vibrio salinus]MCE0494130.1 type IV pilus twitching motility protein PilT [Vibrio salinus]
MSISTLLACAVKYKASDLHLSANCSPMVRIDGRLRKLEFDELAPEKIKSLLFSIMTDEQKADIEACKEMDFGFSHDEIGRFRVNIFRQLRGYSGVFRLITDTIPDLKQLRLPEIILSDFINRKQGLVLVTGPTGSGKSTTLTAMIHHVNQTMEKHIITIEDPIEFVHQSELSLVQQREIGTDTLNFHAALKAALREDPDIIFVGELRDLDSMRLALTAAETGHLVLASLHTQSASKTVDRIVDVFPSREQARVRVQLSESLAGVVSQRLCALQGGGRIGCYEVMVNTPAVSNLIREGNTSQIESAIQAGRQFGMMTLDQAKQEILNTGIALSSTEIQTNFLK